MKTKYIEIPEVVCLHMTDRALKIATNKGDECWVPLSTLSEESEVLEEGDEGTLLIEEDFARNKDELIHYLDD